MMKKYILSLFAMMLVILSSCSNEDVPYSEKVTFKINPSTVVNSYHEYSPGELSSLASDENLRIRLFVYDENGNLAASAEEYMNDYTHIMDASLDLAMGDYKAVVITDITSDDKTFEYWNLEGAQNLSTLTITDAGYVGGRNKILGLNVVNITVDGNVGTFGIDVRPGGALALVHFQQWNRYTNVEDYVLYANRSCDSMKFDQYGNPSYSVEASSNVASWRLAMMGYDSSYSGGYTYVFLFPMQNVTMQFGAILTTGKYTLFSNAKCVADIEAGREYLFTYDITNDEASWTVYNTKSVPGKYSGKEVYENNGFINKQSIRVADMPMGEAY